MPIRHLIFIGFATILFLALPFVPKPAAAEEALMNGEIPLMEGTRVVKVTVEGPMGHFVLEVPAPVDEVVDYYRQAMAGKGWPPGSVSTIGDRGAHHAQRWPAAVCLTRPTRKRPHQGYPDAHGTLGQACRHKQRFYQQSGLDMNERPPPE